MTQAFPLILISSPEDFSDEMVLLEEMFHRGLGKLHLRKPRKNTRAMERWILDLAPEFRKFLVIHGHEELVLPFGLAGSHSLATSVDHQGTRSFSAHSFAEILDSANFDYCTLSPIFDSFSKVDYPSTFIESELASNIAYCQQRHPALAIYALGGIDASRLKQLKNWGFSGAAILGAVWNTSDPLKAWDILRDTAFQIMDMQAPEYTPILSWRERLVVRRGDCR